MGKRTFKNTKQQQKKSLLSRISLLSHLSRNDLKVLVNDPIRLRKFFSSLLMPTAY